MRRASWALELCGTGLTVAVWTAWLLAAQPHRAVELVAAGWRAFDQGQLGAAEKAFTEARRLEPANPDAALALGQVYLQTGRASQAVVQLKTALAAAPGDPDVRFLLAQAHQAADDDLRALRVLDGPVPAGPLADTWKFSRAFSLFRLGRIPAAEPLFRAMTSKPEVRAPAWFFLGNCAFSQQRFSEAVSHYAEAVRFGDSPDNRALNAYHYNQGLAFYELRRFEEAAGAFERSIQRLSTDPLPWLFLGRCRMELNRTEEARAALEESIRVAPKFRLGYYQLARLHAQLGEQQRADELFRKVSELRGAELAQEEAMARRLKLPGR